MARGIFKLSARAIAAAKEPGLYGDGGGLYLQVADVDGKGPTKSWCFRFMLDRRARKMGLGSLNDFGLSEARERARQARQLVSDGRDPIEARLAARDAARKDTAEAITFKAAVDKFLSVHSGSWRNEKHRRQWLSSLEQYAIPTLGTRPVKAIDAALVNSALADCWRRVPVTAGRTRQRILRIVEWVRSGMPLPQASAVKQVKHHPALSWQEIPQFMAELRERDSISARALEFTVLTAARTGETIGATWDEIDLDARTWTIAGERMKGGRTHRVPLSGRALEILTALPRITGERHIFPGAKKGASLSNMALLQLLWSMRGRTLTVHGFRSSFRDWAAEATNTPSFVAEMALAHAVKNQVERSYRRGELLTKRAALMEAWAVYCARPPIEAGNVTPLHGRA